MTGALIIAAPLALVISLITAGHLIATAQTGPPACGNAEMQDQIRAGMYVALDDGFRQQVSSLFLVWMKDSRSQPARAKAGIDNAVAAYTHGYQAIEKWRLPPCR